MFSLVLPFYNEEACVEEVVRSLITLRHQNKLPIKFILVDNGSSDATGKIISGLIREFSQIEKVTVGRNRGYGYGIRQGLKKCKTKYIGFMCGDGQIDAKDVTGVIKRLQQNPELDLCKVKRVKRYDGLQRRLVSWLYNFLFRILFNVSVTDINGTPKLFKRKWNKQLILRSDDWFIDAELMLKAWHNKLIIEELPVSFYVRKTGFSNVRGATMLEFLVNMFKFKLKGKS